MEIEKLIDTVDDVDTLRKICKAMERDVWSFKFKYECVEKERKELKEENEKLQKLLELDSEEVSGLRGKNIVIEVGGK